LLEHDSSCQVSIDNGSTDNIHVLIVQYGLRVEIKESKKKIVVEDISLKAANLVHKKWQECGVLRYLSLNLIYFMYLFNKYTY